MRSLVRVALLIGSAALIAGCAGSLPPSPQAAAPTADASASPSATASPSPTPSPTRYSAASDAALPTPLPPDTPSATPEPTAGLTPPPGATPFPTPGPTITPGSTRVIGTVVRADGAAAVGVCVVLEKGICPIATDEGGSWFTDIPAGAINWNFIYKINGAEIGRQSVYGTKVGELRLPVYTITG